MKMEGNITIKDKFGRTLLQTKECRCVIARFPDMDNEMKERIIELYTDLTGKSSKKVRDFLNFKSENQEFCS